MNNTIVLIGRLTRKPELRYTNSNKAVANETIAVQRDYKNSSGEYETDFIDFQIWEKRAETMANYCEKGDLIGIKGSLRIENYQDNEGNNRKKSYVFVERVSFLQTKPKKEENKESNKMRDDVFREFGEQIQIDEGDLPF